uniref:Uncharacterized protein n=1 Tax=Hyaloperonospora arabidopsidis (strain Emoy2) TaxID=559515 RepID=M4BEL8_HYAAE
MVSATEEVITEKTLLTRCCDTNCRPFDLSRKTAGCCQESLLGRAVTIRRQGCHRAA